MVLWCILAAESTELFNLKLIHMKVRLRNRFPGEDSPVPHAWILVPTSKEEESQFLKIAAEASQGTEFSHLAGYNPCRPPEHCTSLSFGFGGYRDCSLRKDPDVGEYSGGTLFNLHETEAPLSELCSLAAIGNVCRLFTGKVIFINHGKLTSGEPVLFVAGSVCRQCNDSIISTPHVRYGLCPDCYHPK